MVQVFDLYQDSAAGTLGKSLGQGLGAFAERRQKEQQGGILSRVLSGEATEEERAQLDPDTQLQLAKMQATTQANQQKQLQQQQIADQKQRLGEEKQRLAERKEDEKLSPFQKKMKEKIAEYLMEAIENKGKIAGTRTDIAKLRDLSTKLQGPVGVGRALYGSREAAEIKATGMTVLAATGIHVAIVTFEGNEPFKISQGNTIRLQIILGRTDTMVATTFEGVMPLFYFQVSTATKQLIESTLNLHLYPALDHAFTVFRDQSLQEPMDYGGVTKQGISRSAEAVNAPLPTPEPTPEPIPVGDLPHAHFPTSRPLGIQ